MKRKSERSRRRRIRSAGITRYRTGQDALTEPEVEILLKSCTHLEDQVLLRLTIATGMRREDVVGVRLEGVNLTEGSVTFYEHKKRMTWTSYYGPDTRNLLEMYIRTLPKGTPWLFPSPRDFRRPISSRHAYNVLQRWLDRAGLRRRPFHALRATCMKLLQKKGWKPEAIMAQTGDSYETIMEHYATPSRDEMIQAGIQGY